MRATDRQQWSPSADVPTVRLGWHHMVFQIPAPWEVTGYKTNPADGQIVLGDRDGETMRAYWKTVRDDPAPERRLVNAIVEQSGGAVTREKAQVEIQDVAGWKAFVRQAGGVNALACRYEESSRALLLLIFPAHPDTRDRPAVETVLRSYAPNHGLERVWAAFGLDVTLPEDFDLESAEPYPAAQVMRFQNRKGASVAVHRYGMLSLILSEEDMATFFSRVKGAKTLLYQAGTLLEDGKHCGVNLAYTTRGRGGIEGRASSRAPGKAGWRCGAATKTSGCTP